MQCCYKDEVGCKGCTQPYYIKCADYVRARNKHLIAPLGEFTKTPYLPFKGRLVYSADDNLAKTASAMMACTTGREVRVMNFELMYSWISVHGLYDSNREPEYLLNRVVYIDLSSPLTMNRESVCSILTQFLTYMDELKVPVSCHLNIKAVGSVPDCLTRLERA